MTKCYLCGVELTEKTKSKEHIILNAIGGRYVSEKLICKECNNKYGSKCDAILAEQFKSFVNFLVLDLQRGNPRPIFMTDSDEERYIVRNGEKPLLKKPSIDIVDLSDNEKQIKIEARSKEELENILRGLKRKYSDINIEDIKKAEVRKQQIPILHTSSKLGGKEVFPAILKMAVSFYIDKTDDISSVVNAIEDIKNNETDRIELAIFERNIFTLQNYEVTHSIYVKGNHEKHKLYAIIELFSFQTFIVKLSNNYIGDDYEEIYIYDVLQNKELKKQIEWSPDIDFIFNFDYPNSNPNFKIAESKLSRVIGIAIERQNKIHQEKFKKAIIDSTIEKVKNYFDKGINPTKELIEYVLNEERNKHNLYA